MNAAVGRNKGFLGGILGRCIVAQQTVGHIESQTLVADYQAIEGIQVALLGGLDDELLIHASAGLLQKPGCKCCARPTSLLPVQPPLQPRRPARQGCPTTRRATWRPAE